LEEGASDLFFRIFKRAKRSMRKKKKKKRQIEKTPTNEDIKKGATVIKSSRTGAGSQLNLLLLVLMVPISHPTLCR
jgi:hypothetical protein